jgi:hypothetical protein
MLERWMDVKSVSSQINFLGIDFPDNSRIFRQTLETNRATILHE